jgi:hypothetical protein
MKPIDLPNLFFKKKKNYGAFHDALLRVGCFSREMGDVMTLTMDKLCAAHDMSCIHIEHWHDLVQADARTIRNIMKVDANGKPVYKSTSYDLLNYLSLCLQFVDDSYAEYVDAWCYCRVMCIDDTEEE